jgi:hypothetical protein
VSIFFRPTMQTYYQLEMPVHLPTHKPRNTSGRSIAAFACASLFSCGVVFFSFDALEQAQGWNFALPARVVARPTIAYASKSPFSFGKDDDETPPPKSGFSFSLSGSKRETKVAPQPKPTNALSTAISSEALESVGRITTVGAKVVSELALYLAFNTAYFITNTYQYLSKEEQQLLAKETVDKQLPELLALLGGTTDTLTKTASAVASTDEYKELQRQASDAAQQLTKGIKTETPAPEVIEKLKKIVADQDGQVMSEERKSAFLDTLKKGGIKGAELSLYLFYNVFSVLKNLDKVLPTPEQTGGIEGKVEALQLKAAEFAEQVKQLPTEASKLQQKAEEIRASIPTAQDLANLDPAEVSLAVRGGLASAKVNLEKALATIAEGLKEDSEFRAVLKDLSIKLRPVTDSLGAAVNKLPLPKKEDGSVDYSKLLADSGIVTIKGIKALIEATKKAAGSVQSKSIQE